MVSINDCFYSPEKQGLFLVTGLINKGVKVRTIYRVVHAPESNNYFDQIELGYYSKGDILCHSTYLTGEQLISSELFFKIEKLIELNSLTCRTLCISAEKLTTGDTKVVYGDYWLLITNKYGDLNITRHNLFVTKHSSASAFYYINEETYQKIKTNCDNTIKLIDDIWPTSK